MNLLYTLMLLISISFFVQAQNPFYTHKQITQGNYGYGTLSSGEFMYWKYYIPAGTIPVFTLKNESSSSDFDIYIYSDQSHNSVINSGTNSGVTNELVLLPFYDYDKYVYIKVENDGNYRSTYNLYAHYIDFLELGEQIFIDASAQYLLEEGLKWLLDIEEEYDDVDDYDFSNAFSLILSGLKGENLTNISKNFQINKITGELRKEFGYGFWGDFLVNYGIKVFDEVYKYY